MTTQIRNFADADVSRIVDLLNETYRNSYEFVPFNADSLRSRVREGKLKILVSIEKDEILGSAAYHDGYWGEEIEWLVVPECPNKKLVEDTLLREAEKYVTKGAVFTVVDDGSPQIAEWAERGYRLEGGLYHLTVRINGLKPLPKVPEGILLRSLRPQEERALVEAVNAGFDWERLKVGAIQEWKDECPPFDEEWVHVAEHDNKIVSVVASKPDVQYNKFFGGNRGYLGPATTLQEYRGKNLASALTVRAMNLLFEKGMASAALHTTEQNTASIALLRKLGFEVGHHWRFMRKNLQPEK